MAPARRSPAVIIPAASAEAPLSAQRCRPFIVGVAGPSACGKTTFCRALRDALGAASCLLISHDDYYRDLGHLVLQERERHNFDTPDALETDLLVEHLEQLRSGRCVRKPLYDFTRHRRCEQGETVSPAAVIVVEGILVLACPELRGVCDLRVYMDTPADICLARRVLRDVGERGRSVRFCIDQYLRTVRPMQQEWVVPSAQYAQVVVTAEDDTNGVRRVLDLISERAGRDSGGSPS